MLIGQFHADADGYVGRLQTLTLDIALRLSPLSASAQERAPDWRVHLGEQGAGHGIEVGSGWTHDGRNGAFVTLQLDCPSFARPIRANLVRSNGDEQLYLLLWSPRQRRPKTV